MGLNRKHVTILLACQLIIPISIIFRYAMTLVPVASGSAAEPLYWTLVDNEHQGFSRNSFSDIQIYAINFGIKHLLFDHYLRSDFVWFAAAAIILLVAMWIYSTSLFITVIAVLNIFFALEMTYFLYTFVMEITFFPFMNLLAVAILIGIGFDDIFIYCKVWTLAKLEKNIGTLEKIISDSLRHALLSMLVTSFTTAGAFYASLVSNITALKCFAIFAGTAVIVNYVLMITLIPSAMVIYEKWCSECTSCSGGYKLTAKVPICGYFMCQLPLKLYYAICKWTRIIFEKILPCVVVRVRYIWLLTFGGVALFGMIVIFYHPRLRLPSSNEFQVRIPHISLFLIFTSRIRSTHDKGYVYTSNLFCPQTVPAPLTPPLLRDRLRANTPNFPSLIIGTPAARGTQSIFELPLCLAYMYLTTVEINVLVAQIKLVCCRCSH